MQPRRLRILILGGTKEAVQKAAELVTQGHDVTTSLAGRTREPTPPAGALRVGGFGGVRGLRDHLQEMQIDRLIDATHPFATGISENARLAAQLAGVPLDTVSRPPWQQKSGDNWREVSCLKQAADTIEGGSRVLLALGSQYLATFQNRDDVFFLIRMVDAPPEPLLFAQHKLLLGKPGRDAAQEEEVLNAHAINCIVCRNSGGSGAYAKIEAARNLGLPVIMVRRSA